VRIVEKELTGLMEKFAIEAYKAEYYGKKATLKLSDSEILGRWNTIKELVSKYWTDGEHHGDCTKEPARCYRCLMEECVDEVKEKMQELTDRMRNQEVCKKCPDGKKLCDGRTTCGKVGQLGQLMIETLGGRPLSCPYELEHEISDSKVLLLKSNSQSDVVKGD
jgi:hypothetical protein